MDLWPGGQTSKESLYGDWPPFMNTLYLTKRLVQGKPKHALHKKLWFSFDVNKRESAVG